MTEPVRMSEGFFSRCNIVGGVVGEDSAVKVKKGQIREIYIFLHALMNKEQKIIRFLFYLDHIIT